MMSTVLPSESLLTHGNSNPLFPLCGGFTSWESLEYFFSSSEKYDLESKPNLGYHHAEVVLDSDKPNLGIYHLGSDLGLESQNNENSPPFDQSNLNCHPAKSNSSLDSPNQQSPCFNQPNLSCHPVKSDLGLDSPNQQSPCFNGNDQYQPNQNSPMSSCSSGGSDDPNQNGSSSNSCQHDRKRKRMISNRESARRSRMRKQEHVQNLLNNANQLKIQTREKSNQLRLMNHQIHVVKRENERLKAESITLQRKLMQLSQIWQLQQLQQQQCSYDHHHHPPPPPAPSCNPMQIII
ncbi:bZIP transcription factor 2 [Bienertia sinuspersici]